MTSYVATMSVERRTISGYKPSTLYGYGSTPHEAFSDVYSAIAMANRGQDLKTPVMRQLGKPTIRKE